MAEGSPQGKREALIRLVKERMDRLEYADSPSATLVHNFFLSLLNLYKNGDEICHADESVITHGGTYDMYLISKDKPYSDDGTPEGIRREVLRMLDSAIEQAEPKGRIFNTLFRNALHVARENGCLQATISKKEDNWYVVTLEITFPSVECESAPLATAGEIERRSTPDTPPDAPPPLRARSGRRVAPKGAVKEAGNVIAFSDARERRKPVRERLVDIVQARLARCEQEAGCDTALFCEAAECAVALQDRQAAQRLIERELDGDPKDIITIARLTLLAGETEYARKILTILEEGGRECCELAALITAAMPEPQAALRLLPQLEAAGLLRAAAIVAVKIGDRESALRMMQRAKDQGIEILDEKTLGAFSLLALFDTHLAKEIMDLFASIAGSDDLDNIFIDMVLYEAGCIAMAVGERNTVRKMAEALQKRESLHLATPLFGMLGELQIVQELILKTEEEKPEFWNDIYWSVLVDISRYNLEAGFEVLKLLERRGYDIAVVATRIMDMLHWKEHDVGKGA